MSSNQFENCLADETADPPPCNGKQRLLQSLLLSAQRSQLHALWQGAIGGAQQRCAVTARLGWFY